MRCHSCGEENPERARFCLACGRPLAAPARTDAVGTRRVVTVLFVDMVGSTAFAERHDPEVVRWVQEGFFSALGSTIERHGGTVEKYAGDAVMAVFGWPRAHEDDAIRALRAASEFAAALGPLNEALAARDQTTIQIRVGVASGPVVAAAGASDALVTGDAVNVAARLEGMAAPGEIVMSSTTQGSARGLIDAESLGPIEVRGRSARVEAYRLRGIAPVPKRRLGDLPLVGRRRELARLRRALDDVVSETAPALAVVIGPAGAGKSRLIREFLSEAHGRVETLRGRCLAYGDAITYWPIAEILRDAAGAGPDAAPATVVAALERRLGAELPTRLRTIVATILGGTSAAIDTEEITWGFLRLLRLLGASSPVVVLVEDVHWADPALLDLLETTRVWAGSIPLLLLVTARPELLELRPDWVRPDPRVVWLPLDPLDAADADGLVDGIPGGSAITGSLRARLVETAGGNPLFLEEYVGMLVDRGWLRSEGGSWVAAPDLDDLPVPATVSALLAARLDALEASEQALAERGSIVGRTFERGAVAALWAPAGQGLLVEGLRRLLRRELIEADGDGLDGGEAYRFRHILIRDAAYERLPKAERARLHEAFVDWLDGVVGPSLDEHVEIAAHHLAAAAAYRWELAALETTTSDLAVRAIARLERAADRSERLNAYPEATRHLRRAVELSDHGGDSVRGVDLRRRLAAAEYLAGDPGTAIDVAEAAIDRLQERGGRQEAAILGELARYRAAFGDLPGGLATSDRAIALAEADTAVGLHLHLLNERARILMVSHAAHEGRDTAQRAVTVARQHRQEGELSNALSTLGVCLMELDRRDDAYAALAEARDIAKREGDPEAQVRAMINLEAFFETGMHRQERLEQGRAVVDLVERLGLTGFAPTAILNLSVSTLWAGDPASAETLAERVIAERAPGEITAWADLLRASAQASQGRFEEAEVTMVAARDLLTRLHVPAQELDWEIVEADIAAWRGRPSDAIEIVEAGLARDDDHRPRKVARILSIGIRSAVDARRPATARRYGRRSREIVDSTPATALSWEGHAAMALAVAELTRLGPPRPAVWRNAIQHIREANVPPFEAYARWRLVEALSAASAPAQAVAAARAEALEVARAVGAQHLVDQLEAKA